MESPIIRQSDAELKILEMQRVSQQYSYDLTQRLTFFVISLELVFCGYMLLNANKLAGIQFLSLLFLSAGVAALLGIAWRFFYNQTFHDGTHGKTRKTQILSRLQFAVYWGYISLTVVFLIATIIVGYLYLQKFENTSVSTGAFQNPSVSDN